jgi:ribosomal protein S18 acetylase RimI-like enzyme
LQDSGVEPRDGALTAYLEGKHHPRDALVARAAYLALVADQIVGYVAGHLTRRYGCDAEVQHLWVAPRYRRLGIGTELLRRQQSWFASQAAARVCVNVAADNEVAQVFFRGRGARDIRPSWLGWTE